jgi:translation elongation factor P
VTLPPLQVSRRLDQLRARLADAGVEGLIVTNLANLRYLTGFTGSAGVLAVTEGDALLTTDGRYRTQSAQQVAESGAAVEIAVGGVQAQRESVQALLGSVPRVGLEADDVSWTASRRWADLIPQVLPTSGVVEALREVKDEGEIARMARAAAIADASLGEVLPLLASAAAHDLSEEVFALALDTAMRRGGAESTAFETIVASGPNSAKPHHRPTDRLIRAGDPVVVDFGATYDGYRSDMTRTFCIGGEPSGELARVFEVVRESQAGGVAAVRPGAGTKDVDDVCRRVIAEAGWAEAFEHGTGHGQPAGHCYPLTRRGRHGGAGGIPPRHRRGPYRGHPGRHRGRQPPAHHLHERRDRLMAVSTNDLKNGMTLDLPEGLFGVVEFQHVKPGKGGAFVRTKLKNVRTGAVVERTYRADEKLEQAIIDKREMQFLYRDGTEYVFMDTSTYEQLQVPPSALGDAGKYLKETDEAILQLYEDEIVGVELPAAVELTVAETEPGLQGDRASGARKPATLQTGLVVQVPLFVNLGDVIKVDTRTGEYLTRA